MRNWRAWVLIGLAAACLRTGAQTPPPGSAVGAAATRPLPGDPQGATNQPVRRAPALPGSRSPVDTFRELLAMPPAQRAKALAERTEHERKYVEARLREYTALSPAERESRLQQLELTYYVDGLIKLAPAERVTRLEMVPPALRPLIDERLREWDLLPPEVKRSVLQNQAAANYFVRPSEPPSPEPSRSFVSATASSERGGKWTEQVLQFLNLPAKAQRQTLEALPPGERVEMQTALGVLSKMAPEQRRVCLASFERLRQMSPSDREQFLQSAARWQAMSAAERATWQRLVTVLMPGPGLGAATPPGTREGLSSTTASNRASSPPVPGVGTGE